MSRQAGILVALGAVVATAVGAALFLVLSDPSPAPDDGGESTETVATAPEQGEPEGEEKSTGRRHARVPGGAELHGVVRKADDDQPVAAQAVRVVGEAVGTIEVTTDSSGGFRFAELPPGGPYAVEVDAEGYAPIRLPGLALDRSEERDLGTLLLDLAVRVEVHVSDMRGEPLGAATVAAYAAPEIGFGFDWSKAMAQMGQAPVSVAHVDTGADGVAVFDELASGSWTFVARKDGYASTGRSSLRLRSRTDPEPVRLHLARGHSLTGRVFDGDGNPVTGVLVMAGGGNAWDLGAAALRSRSTTGEDGRYAFSALAAGDTPVWVAPPGSVPAQIVMLRVPDVPVFDIHLGKCSTVRGTVTVKETGEPVEGALVRAASWGSMGSRNAEATTDAEGHYTIEELPEGTLAGVTVEKEGLTQVVDTAAGQQQQPLVAGAAVVKDAQMAPAAVVTGVVRGPDGPVSGARVIVMLQIPNSFQQKQASTDSEGRYRVDGLTAGNFVVQAGAAGLYLPDFPQNWWMALQSGDLPEAISGETVAGEETERDIVLRRGTTISGRVETADGEPVAGASVTAASNNGWMSAAPEPAVTTDDGTFRVEGVAPAPAVMLAASYKGMTMVPRDPVALTDGEPLEGEIVVLQKQPVVKGRVTTATGDLPEDAWVMVYPAQVGNNATPYFPGFMGNSMPRFPVHADGTYEATVGWAQGGLQVMAGAPGSPSASSDVVALEEGRIEYDVDVQLAGGHELSGRVVSDMTNEGVAGAHVRVWASQGGGTDSMEIVQMGGIVQYGRGGGGGGGAVVAITDESGAFRVDGLSEGNQTVSAQAEGFVPGNVQSRTPNTGQVTLPLAPEMEISGTVVLGDGSPVAGVNVTASSSESASNGPRGFPVMPGGGGGAAAMTDAQGHFVLRKLKRGQYVLNVQNNWNGRANVQPYTSQPTAAGSKDVQLVVQAGLKISGRVVDEAGDGVSPCWIWARPDSTPEGVTANPVNVQAQQDGTFELVGLSSSVSTFTITFNAQAMGGGGYTPVTLEKIAPGTTGLEVVMSSGLTIEGKILDDEGKPIGNAWVMAQPVRQEGEEGSRSSANAMVQADGTFKIGGLQAGPYRLQVNAWSQTGGQKQLVLEGADRIAAGSKDLRLTATAGATISGTVTDESGQAVPNANVWASAADGGRNQSTRTGADGTFEIGGLSDGATYTVEARASGKIGAKVEGVTSGSTNVRLELRTGVSVEGRVLAADGAPLAQAWVYLQPVDRPDLTRQNARTDADGRFTAGGLADGVSYTVSARIRDGRTWKNMELGTVRAGDTGIELRASE